MRKFGWMMVLVIFLVGGCASNVPKRVAQGSAFGAAAGYVIGGGAGAKIGAAAGAAAGVLGGAIEDETKPSQTVSVNTQSSPSVFAGIFKTRQPQVVVKVFNGLAYPVIIRYTDTLDQEHEVSLGKIGQANIAFPRQYLSKTSILTASVIEEGVPIGTTAFGIEVLSRRHRRSDAEVVWHITGYVPLQR